MGYGYGYGYGASASGVHLLCVEPLSNSVMFAVEFKERFKVAFCSPGSAPLGIYNVSCHAACPYEMGVNVGKRGGRRVISLSLPLSLPPLTLSHSLAHPLSSILAVPHSRLCERGWRRHTRDARGATQKDGRALTSLRPSYLAPPSRVSPRSWSCRKTKANAPGPLPTHMLFLYAESNHFIYG